MSEWASARLCEVADVRVSNVDKKSLSTEQAVLLCNYMDVYSNDYITGDLNFMKATATPSQIERFRVAPGDVMITKDSETPEDIGIPSVTVDAVPNLICGYHLALLKPDPKKIDGRYLAKQLGTRDTARYFAQRAAGSTRYGLSNGTIASTPIPLAPLPQQRRIAEILTTLDEEIEATESLIGKYQQIKAGLMHDLFTRGLWTQAELARSDHKGTPAESTAKPNHLRPSPEHAPQLYQESPIGIVPKEWAIRRLGEILRECGGNLQTGPFGSQLHAYEYQTEGVSVVMPQDINDGVISEIQIARIHESRAQELARHRVRLGDVVIARRGDLSRSAAIVHEQIGWLCGTGCFLLRLTGSALRADFASCVYRHDFIQRQIDGMAVGTTMPSLNNGVMARLWFPFCSPHE